MIKLMENRSYVDGFFEILEIKETKVILSYRKYNLIIEGEGLKITAFSKSELILFGKMLHVFFDYNVK